MELQAILDELRADFTYLNKPKGSDYRVVTYHAGSNWLADYDKLIDHCNACCGESSESPRLLFRQGQRLAAIRSFKEHHASYRTGFPEVFRAADTAYFLFSAPTEKSRQYDLNRAEIAACHDKYKRTAMDAMVAANRKGPLYRLLASGALISLTRVGTCGDYCDYVASRILREGWIDRKDLDSVQFVQVDFQTGPQQIEFSHCFIILNATQPFSKNLRGLDDAVIVDPWNLYAMEVGALKASEEAQTDFMRFILDNVQNFEVKVVFDSGRDLGQILDAKPLLPGPKKLERIKRIANRVHALNP